MIIDEVRDRQRDVVARLMEYWSYADGAREDKKRENVDAIRAYHYKHPKGKVIPRGKSRAMLPFAHVAGRTLVADTVGGIIPFPRFFRVRMQELEDEGAAESITAELLWMVQQMELPRWLRTLVLQAALCGSSPYDLGWTTRTRIVSRPVLRGGAGLMEMVKAATGGRFQEALQAARAQFTGFEMQREERVIYEGPRLQVLDWFDVAFDPAPPDGLDETEIFRQVQTRVTPAAMRRMAQDQEFGYAKYENVDQVKLDRPGSSVASEDEWRRDRYQALGLDLSQTSFDGGPLLRHHYGPFDAVIDGDHLSLENVVATYHPDSETLLRFEWNTNPSGEIPVQQITWTEPGVPGNPSAVGFAGPCLSVGGFLNNLANDFRDNVAKIAKGQKSVLDTSPLLESGVNVEMDGILPVHSHADIQPIQHDGKIFDLVAVMSHFELLYNKLAGAESKNSLEMQARTATEMAQVGAAIASERQERVHHIQTQVERILYELCSLRAAYGPERSVGRRVEDADGNMIMALVDPELFEQSFTIECVGAGVVAEKAQQLSGIFQIIEMVTKMPPEAQLRINFESMVKLAWELAVGRNETEIIRPMAELEAMILEIERSRAAEAGGGAGAPGAGSASGVVPIRGAAGGNEAQRAV